MNVVFLLGDSTSKGGIEKVIMTLASALSKHYNSSILSLYRTNDKVCFSHENVTIDYVNNGFETSMYNRPYNAFLGILFDMLYILLKALPLRGALKKHKAHVIITCDIKMTMLAYLSSIFTGCKVIAVEHFEYDVPNVFLKKIRKILYRLTDAVVILTDEDFSKYSWLDNSKLHIIPNIVSVKKLEGIVKKQNQIIGVGRLCYQKGFDLLIRAWSKIEHQYPNWCLKIYGEGEEEDALNMLIKKMNLTNVELHPFTKDIDIVYQQSKIFVLSSRFEGLGMVLLEALSHELPCISYNCPAGPKTIIKNNYNGLLISTGDIDELSQALSSLVSNESLRNKYSRNALPSIEQYSVSSVATKWTKLINGITYE